MALHVSIMFHVLSEVKVEVQVPQLDTLHPKIVDPARLLQNSPNYAELPSTSLNFPSVPSLSRPASRNARNALLCRFMKAPVGTGDLAGAL